ncbi:MAG: hypothetical protein WBQ78_13350 [Gammaproteobacteria bacterium]
MFFVSVALDPVTPQPYRPAGRYRDTQPAGTGYRDTRQQCQTVRDEQ